GWIKSDHLLVGGDRAVQVFPGPQDVPQVEMGRYEVRVDTKRRSVRRCRLVQLSLARQSNAQVVTGIRVQRVEPDRLLESRDGSVPVAVGLQDPPQAKMGTR